ncbi:phage replication protein O, N-terminal domain-containing protein [Izhakiella capsodis]|uniref:Phage replication protein O, N-terminal domain-containing protein n=1 Tax=Izhakiella capsodis TaxID=1367852 RepID=A0A1I5BQQ9_9GAMM|nr:replication protein [Izhakiella capsodis]SFN76989.1 phage replication protein O, N-terminal domain-containing protein [Izhakiella capsodis]
MNLAHEKVTPIRPNLEVVEVRVADLDDGYARLSNELLEEYAGADLTKRQFKVLLAILRKTYGWNKPMDRISDSQIAEIAKLPVKRCNETKLELVRMGLIRQQGGMFGPNKNISEWCIPQNRGSSLKTGDKTPLNLGDSNPSKQGDTKDTITKEKKDNTQTHKVGCNVDVKLTTGKKGKNPGARGTNSKAKMPEFDRQRFKDTWNCKAEQYGLPKILSVTVTHENGLKRLWHSYLKQCREIGREPKDIDSILNGYIEFGYTPTAWACGNNPEGKKYGIETAFRQEKIDQILAEDAG